MTTMNQRGAARGASARRRLGLSVAAAAVVGAMLPLGAGTAQALPTADSRAAGKSAEPGFAGYATTAGGTPMKVEIYESTIPIPATPQAELNYGYSAVIADSSSSRARSSYLWPGAPVGEGFKTIAENLGLPPEMSGPIGENGYPIQVNAVHPGGPEEERDEPFPGTIQRAKALADQATASTGYSTDGNVKDEDAGSGDGGGGDGGGGAPGLPELPPLPGLPGLTGGGGVGGLGSSRASSAAEEPEPSSGLPPELAALVDVGGFTSLSKTLNGDLAFAQARSGTSVVSLLGGLVTIDGVKTVARASSNGAKGVAEGQASYGDLVAFGQRFRYGSDGYEAVGQKGKIPGLPDDAAKALAQLGLAVRTPEATYTVDGDAATTEMPGLVLDFDLTALRSQMGPLTGALNEIVNQIPSETRELKSLIQAAVNLSPRIVFTLGYSTASVDTSQAIDLPPLDIDPVEPEPTDTEPAAPAGSSGGASSGGAISGGAGPDSGAPVSGELPPSSSGELAVPVSASQQPGLPGLFSIPMLLILGGIALASVAGTFARRMGLAVLGGASACPHGLDSGLPDLRKVQ